MYILYAACWEEGLGRKQCQTLLFPCKSTYFQSIVALMSPKEQAVNFFVDLGFWHSRAAQKDIEVSQSPDFAAEATVAISASKFRMQRAGKSTVH